MNEVSTDMVRITEDQIRGAAKAGVRAAGLPATRVSNRGAGYYHSSGTTWDVKTDSSCGYGGTGWELASPAMVMDENAECAELREVCNAVKALGPRIDKKCGLHVHVEVRDYTHDDLRRLLILWARYEPFFFELCPPSRSTSAHARTYCPPIRKATWADSDSGHWSRLEIGLNEQVMPHSEGRFQSTMSHAPRGAVNLAHFWTGKRIEFRLAAGTIEYEKIQRWAQVLLALVARAKHPTMPVATPGAWSNTSFSVRYIAKMLGLAASQHMPASEVSPESEKLIAWMEARRAQFAPRGTNAIDTAVARGYSADGGR